MNRTSILYADYGNLLLNCIPYNEILICTYMENKVFFFFFFFQFFPFFSQFNNFILYNKDSILKIVTSTDAQIGIQTKKVFCPPPLFFAKATKTRIVKIE